MGSRFGVLALGAMSATGALQGISSAQSDRPPSPDPQVTVFEPPASRSLDVVHVQAAPARGLRPLGPEAEELLAEARRISPTVRRLVGELATSDVLVYVEFRIPRSIRTAQLALLGGDGWVRYLKIEVFGITHVKADIAWLAHELQHAVEIASARDVTDDAGVKRLYRRIGRPSRTGQDTFETDAAIAVRNQVLAELQSPPSTLALTRLLR